MAAARMALALAAVCCAFACSKKFQEEDKINQDIDPMKFTGAGEVENNFSSKATSPLTTGFMVSAYKSYGNAAKQQTVMDRYSVEFKVDGWSNSKQWNYVGVNGQTLKYWDYSNFPYRFNAVAPCPANPQAFTLSDNAVTIPATYLSQACADGSVTPADAEPYLLAQVQRNNDGTDRDVYAGRAANTGSTSKNRDVALPFHHLNSKVRFGMYTTDLFATEVRMYVKNLSVSVASADFVTKAGGYSASGADSWYQPDGASGFTGLTRTAAGHTLLTYTGGASVPENDLRQWQFKKNAYMFLCPDGLMQIPQEGVKLCVSLDLMKEGQTEPYREYRNVPIKLETGEDTFHWQPGYIYSYYLVIGPFEGLSLQFTAVLTPWDELAGNLSTDLEQ